MKKYVVKSIGLTGDVYLQPTPEGGFTLAYGPSPFGALETAQRFDDARVAYETAQSWERCGWFRGPGIWPIEEPPPPQSAAKQPRLTFVPVPFTIHPDAKSLRIGYGTADDGVYVEGESGGKWWLVTARRGKRTKVDTGMMFMPGRDFACRLSWTREAGETDGKPSLILCQVVVEGADGQCASSTNIPDELWSGEGDPKRKIWG